MHKMFLASKSSQRHLCRPLDDISQGSWDIETASRFYAAFPLSG